MSLVSHYGYGYSKRLCEDVTSWFITEFYPRHRIYLDVQHRGLKREGTYGYCGATDFKSSYPRNFLIEIDTHLHKELYIKTLFHELTHMGQWIDGSLRFRYGKMCYYKEPVEKYDYNDQPHEIEARENEEILYDLYMMNKSKELDKFYTHPDIAKTFVDKINEMFPLEQYDMVIEPSAGSGNILQYLPDDAVGLDLEPEGPGILKQDFFEYDPGYHPLTNNIRIATIGNPPFGSGYMNPLAKGFFNHAATFSELIAFIIPAKWQTSWKVQFQLDDAYGLYYSQFLPKNSFVFNGEKYDVPCCMQIWSKSNPKNYPDLRIRERPPTKHVDFDMFLTCDNVPKLPAVREQIKNQEYWEFGLKYWGQIRVCDYNEIAETTTTHYLFKAHQPYVRDIFESIDWSKYVSNMGAPNVGGKSLIIKAYTERKAEMGL